MHNYKGAIVAHIGPMFGGKTSGLLADVRKMRIAGYNVALFKPKKDNRYAKEAVVNHDGEQINAIRVENIYDILRCLDEDASIDVIAIDEFQFLNGSSMTPVGMISVLKDLVYKHNKTLLISGLDLDSDLVPFANVKELLPFATHIYKHKAVCVDCGNNATTSYCTVTKDSQELIGGHDKYVPLCIKCYNKRTKAGVNRG